MVEFLTTRGISYHIEQIITDARESLHLISPYLQLPEDLFHRLKEADRRKIRITLVYGKRELNNEQIDQLSELNNLELYFCENLHAKCYFNEDYMVIASMNLHQYSEKNNREMGVLILKEKDKKLFDEALKEAKSILRNSKRDVFPKQSYTNRSHGFCIRCGVKVNYDPEAPFCKGCYYVWAEFQDPFYEEKCCHRCGKPEATSMAKPLCYSCFQAYKG